MSVEGVEAVLQIYNSLIAAVLYMFYVQCTWVIGCVYCVVYMSYVYVWCCSRSLISYIGKYRLLQMVKPSCHRWRDVHWMRVFCWSGRFTESCVNLQCSCVVLLHWNITCKMLMPARLCVVLNVIRLYETWNFFDNCWNVLHFMREYSALLLLLLLLWNLTWFSISELCQHSLLCVVVKWLLCTVFIAVITWTTLRSKRFSLEKFLFQWESFGCLTSVES